MASFFHTVLSAKYAIVAAIVLSLALTPVARAVARKLRVMDMPNEARKHHGRPVPLWGGVAVYLALVGGLIVACLSSAATPELRQLSVTLILASGLVCLVGCIDDRHGLPARFKLALQFVSVLPVVTAGFYFDQIVAFGVPIHLGFWGIPLTIVWLVGCINALNLLDGLDGLASLVGLCAVTHDGDHCFVYRTISCQHRRAASRRRAAELPDLQPAPASIFLGDSGSMVIGLVVGLISIQGAMKTSATLSITVPAIVMSVPLLDTFFAIVRRKLSGQPFDVGDRGQFITNCWNAA